MNHANPRGYRPVEIRLVSVILRGPTVNLKLNLNREFTAPCAKVNLPYTVALLVY